jgi:hypothetical protein
MPNGYTPPAHPVPRLAAPETNLCKRRTPSPTEPATRTQRTTTGPNHLRQTRRENRRQQTPAPKHQRDRFPGRHPPTLCRRETQAGGSPSTHPQSRLPPCRAVHNPDFKSSASACWRARQSGTSIWWRWRQFGHWTVIVRSAAIASSKNFCSTSEFRSANSASVRRMCRWFSLPAISNSHVGRARNASGPGHLRTLGERVSRGRRGDVRRKRARPGPPGGGYAVEPGGASCPDRRGRRGPAAAVGHAGPGEGRPPGRVGRRPLAQPQSRATLYPRLAAVIGDACCSTTSSLRVH